MASFWRTLHVVIQESGPTKMTMEMASGMAVHTTSRSMNRGICSEVRLGVFLT